MTQPKPEILAAVWEHYRTNAAKRTTSKPYRGENWACTLLGFGVPESDLLPADQGRGLKPMTSADAMTRNWWKWKKVYGPELKRLEDANALRTDNTRLDTEGNSDSAVNVSDSSNVATQKGHEEDALKPIKPRALYVSVVDPRTGYDFDVPSQHMDKVGDFTYRVSPSDPTGRILGLYMTVKYGVKGSHGLTLLGRVAPDTLQGEYDPGALPFLVERKRLPVPEARLTVDRAKRTFEIKLIDYPMSVGILSKYEAYLRVDVQIRENIWEPFYARRDVPDYIDIDTLHVRIQVAPTAHEPGRSPYVYLRESLNEKNDGNSGALEGDGSQSTTGGQRDRDGRNKAEDEEHNGGTQSASPGISGDDEREAEIERSRAANERIEEIIAESRADAKMWVVMDYPHRDAVDLGEPRYWIFWYDPKVKEAYNARGRVRNWDNRVMERMYQSPWQLRPEHIYDGSIKVKFSDKYEENRSFNTHCAMLLEEWEHLMRQSPEGKKYLAAQDPNNMPLPNIPVNRSWGRSGRGKDKEMYVDEYGYLWDREADMKAGEPPLNHVTESASAFPALQKRLRVLFPTPPKDHPGL